MVPVNGCSNHRCSRTGSQGNRGPCGATEFVRSFHTIILRPISLVAAQLVLGRQSFRKRRHFRHGRSLLIMPNRSIVINYLQMVFGGGNVAIACIYCNYKEQTTQTVSELIASLLKQLVQDRRGTPDNIKTLYKKHPVSRPKLDDFIKALKSEIGTYSRMFIVVDALDECPESIREDLVKALASLGSAVNLNLVVTSRPLPSIQQLFLYAKRVDVCANNEDVRKYIQARISCEPQLLRHIKTVPALRDSIVDKIIANAKGM